MQMMVQYGERGKKITKKTPRASVKRLTTILGNQATNLINHLRSIGLKVNTKKTQTILFNSKIEVPIEINKTRLMTKTTAKFLGVIFDKHSNYNEHIKELCSKASKSLNLLRSLCHRGLQAPYIVKKVVYRNLLEAKLTYGQEIYHQTSKSILMKLERIQAAALRCLTGAIRGTSTAALQVATNIEPLDIRRNGALLKLWARSWANPTNPTRECFRNPLTQTTAAKYNKATPRMKSATWTAYELKERFGIKTEDILVRNMDIAPWTLDDLSVDTRLSEKLNKKNDSTELLKAIAMEHIDTKYKEHTQIFTDGSRRDEKVSIGAYSKNIQIKISDRITDNNSITTAELVAIRESLKRLQETETTDTKIAILTDSLSAAQILKEPLRPHARPELANDILKLAQRLKRMHKTDVSICWIPAHCGILGNEKADANAKLGLDKEITIKTRLGKQKRTAL